MSSMAVSFGSLIKVAVVPIATVSGAIVGAIGGYVVEERRGTATVEVAGIEAKSEAFSNIIKGSNKEERDHLFDLAVKAGLLEDVSAMTVVSVTSKYPGKVSESFLCSHVLVCF